MAGQLLITGLAAALAWTGAARAAEALSADQENALRDLARGEDAPWPEMSAEQARALHGKAEAYLDIYHRYHLPHGLNADVWWTDYDRTEVHRLEGIGDSAAWTGHYLAALALRHHIEPSVEIRERILAVLDKYDMLVKVSGRPGYIARYAGPASDAGYRGYYEVYGRGEDPARPGLGKRAFVGASPFEELVWLGYSSRDAYDGVNFGLATTLAYVEDAEIEARIKGFVELVADRLIADDWDILDGKGNRTRGNDWFKMAWMRTSLTVNPAKYGHLLNEYDRLCRRLSERKDYVFDIRFKEYFAANLGYVRTFSMCSLEDDPDRRKLLAEVMRRMQGESAAHLNAHFAAIYATLTGDKDNPSVRAAVQGLLIDFPQAPEFHHEVDLRKSPEVELLSEAYTKYAQLPRERVPTDFMWQRSPCVSHGSFDLPYELPGIDVFLPYWMGRVAGVIPAP